jgi:hypothetical protein
VAKTEENEDKRDNEKDNERKTPVDDEKNEVLTDQNKGKDDGNEFSGEEKQNQAERKQNRKETKVTNETDDNVSMHSSLRNEEVVKQEGNEERIKINGIDKTGSNVSMHSSLKDGEVVKQKRANDEKTEVNGTDKKGSNMSIQSLQRVDSWEKMNRNNEKREITNTANEGSKVSIQNSQNEKESIPIVVTDSQSNAHVQDTLQVEFASQLSHKIIDEALESAICGFLPTDTDVERNSNGEDIKDLRELLETNVVVTTTSADPSRTSSQSQLEDDGSTKPKESGTRSGESVDLQVNSSKPVSYPDTSSQSDVDDKDNTDKKPFLDVLSQQLPSADSSDDSSTE